MDGRIDSVEKVKLVLAQERWTTMVQSRSLDRYGITAPQVEPVDRTGNWLPGAILLEANSL